MQVLAPDHGGPPQSELRRLAGSSRSSRRAGSSPLFPAAISRTRAGSTLVRFARGIPGKESLGLCYDFPKLFL